MPVICKDYQLVDQVEIDDNDFSTSSGGKKSKARRLKGAKGPKTDNGVNKIRNFLLSSLFN